jgi:hypothetical protein
MQICKQPKSQQELVNELAELQSVYERSEAVRAQQKKMILKMRD